MIRAYLLALPDVGEAFAGDQPPTWPPQRQPRVCRGRHHGPENDAGALRAAGAEVTLTDRHELDG